METRTCSTKINKSKIHTSARSVEIVTKAHPRKKGNSSVKMKILDINCKYVEGTPRILQQIHIWQIVPIYCYLWQLTFF